MADEREDFRITKTKQALVEAFTSLILEKKFESITVNELCDRAGVRRATFYKHFEDKYDFLIFVIKTHRERFDRLIWKRPKVDATKDYYIQYMQALIGYLERESGIVASILNSNVSHVIIHMMVEQNFLDTKERLGVSISEGMKLGVSTDTAAAMLTGGIALVITRWLVSENRISKDELIREISTVIDSIISETEA